ncbi:MAG: DUF5989 family protein [Victivallaceae bacterium]|nr:DUF5989 family protein [Victivallaceae bacterium]
MKEKQEQDSTIRDLNYEGGLLRELWEQIMQNKKFWLLPLLLILALLAIFILLGSSAAAPFIYTLF